MPLSYIKLGFFEVHFVLSGSKKVILVEKSSMSELDSWICAVLYVYGRNNRFAVESKLQRVIAHAEAHGISKVRWNKVLKMDKKRPSLLFYGDAIGHGIFMKRPGSIPLVDGVTEGTGRTLSSNDRCQLKRILICPSADSSVRNL